MTDVKALLKHMVRIDTTTVVDGNSEGMARVKDCLFLLMQTAEASGAVGDMFTFEGDHEKWPYPVTNLLVTWKKGNPKRQLCFMGHVDTVPVGDHSAWTVSPHGAEEKDGFIYGRGTTDMKGAVAAFFVAMEQVMEQCDDVHVSALITGDEEWAAVNGTDKVLDAMKRSGAKVDAFLVGEPSSPDRLATALKNGRRGSLVGKLISKGTQGHAAYAHDLINPNTGLILACDILSSLDLSFPGEVPTTNFEVIALNAGDFGASAIIPGTAEALWNVRYTPSWSAPELVKHFQNVLKNPPEAYKSHPHLHLLQGVEVVGNLTSASMPYKSPVTGRLNLVAEQVISQIMGVPPVTDMSGGTTDGRFVQKHFPEAEILEFGPPEKGGLATDIRDDAPNPEGYGLRGGMHQLDESILVEDLLGLTRLYAEVVKAYIT